MVAIRPARPSDRETLVTFNQCLARETEGRELDAGRIERGVAEALADPGKARYFVAEVDGRPAGQLMLTFEWSDWRCGWFWWIQSVYVHRDWRGRGVYRALFERVRGEAVDRHDVCGIRLYVERENRAAMAVYDRTGLPAADYEMRELDFRKPPRGG